MRAVTIPERVSSRISRFRQGSSKMLIAISRILFPTDFSESAKEAQQYATELADRFGAELHLLHVIAPFMPYVDAASPWVMPESDMHFLVEAADNRLANELDSRWSGTHRMRHTTVIGFAVDEILKYSTENKIDLIVVGTHGHSGLSRLLIGSVAEKLVRTASCPVLTVHPQGHQFLIESPADCPEHAVV